MSGYDWLRSRHMPVPTQSQPVELLEDDLAEEDLLGDDHEE
jgi:hypothetical protein